MKGDYAQYFCALVMPWGGDTQAVAGVAFNGKTPTQAIKDRFGNEITISALETVSPAPIDEILEYKRQAYQQRRSQ